MTDDRFTLSWKNAEVVLHFLPNKLVVNLFVNNVCVDQKDIAYDEVEATREYYPKFPQYEEAEKIRFTYGLQMNLNVTTIEEKNIEKNEDE